MKIKTQDLIGSALDWAVAVCNGFDIKNPNDLEYIDQAYLVLTEGEVRHYWEVSSYSMNRAYDYRTYRPSTAGSEVIDIVEREGISVVNPAGTSYWVASKFVPETLSGQVKGFGPTLRIAVCRCFVASKLGDEVNVPEELLK